MMDNIIQFPGRDTGTSFSQTSAGSALPRPPVQEETLEQRLAKEYAAGYSPTIRREIESGIQKFLAWAKNSRDYHLSYHGYDTNI